MGREKYSLTPGEAVYTHSDQTARAEILLAIHVAQYNIPFSSAADDVSWFSHSKVFFTIIFKIVKCPTIWNSWFFKRRTYLWCQVCTFYIHVWWNNHTEDWQTIRWLLKVLVSKWWTNYKRLLRVTFRRPLYSFSTCGSFSWISD